MNTWKNLFIFLLVLNFLGCTTGRVRSFQERPTPKKRGFLERLGQLEPSYRDGRPVKIEEFKWPLKKVAVTSPYGKRGSKFHEGIDLKASKGTPVFSAHSGVVLYAGSQISGYGRMVVLRHTRQFASIYAHNSRLLVKKGDFVRQGQRIAVSGNTGRSSGPHLHFEIRRGLEPINPAAFLAMPGSNPERGIKRIEASSKLKASAVRSTARSRS